MFHHLPNFGSGAQSLRPRTCSNFVNFSPSPGKSSLESSQISQVHYSPVCVCVQTLFIIPPNSSFILHRLHHPRPTRVCKSKIHFSHSHRQAYLQISPFSPITKIQLACVYKLFIIHPTQSRSIMRCTNFIHQTGTYKFRSSHRPRNL
jgi:hypothetical protein